MACHKCEVLEKEMEIYKRCYKKTLEQLYMSLQYGVAANKRGQLYLVGALKKLERNYRWENLQLNQTKDKIARLTLEDVRGSCSKKEKPKKKN